MVVIYTCIDGINIPVQPGPLTSVFFSGDCEDPAGFSVLDDAEQRGVADRALACWQRSW